SRAPRVLQSNGSPSAHADHPARTRPACDQSDRAPARPRYSSSVPPARRLRLSYCRRDLLRRFLEDRVVAKQAFKSFRYKSSLVWNSGRRGKTSAPGKPEFDVGSPPEFKGEPGVWSPEELLVGAL